MPNILAASFHKRREVRGLEKVTIRQKFSNHTVTYLDYLFSNRHEYLLPPENSPVSVRWGEGPTGVSAFYGYVNHYETVGDEQGRAYTRMVLLGTSKVLNGVTPSSWAGQSRSNMVRDIATRHRFRSVVHSHPYVTENWTSGTLSDWKCLQQLADETGYRLWVDGATVWFLDPTRALRTASSMSTPHVTRRNLQKVQVWGGSNIPGEMPESKRRIQFGLDYRTNEPFQATSGNNLHPNEVVTTSATSYTEAQEIADAAERKQQDYYLLKATIKGDSRLQPGVITQVDSGRVNNDQGGLWLVNEATHEISRSDFSSKIVATRGVDQQPMNRRVDTVRGTAGLAQAVVRDGVTWEAALQEQVHG